MKNKLHILITFIPKNVSGITVAVTVAYKRTLSPLDIRLRLFHQCK